MPADLHPPTSLAEAAMTIQRRIHAAGQPGSRPRGEAAASRDTAGHEPPHAIVRHSIPIAPVDALTWLSRMKAPRMYWASRDGDFEAAGAGSACQIQAREPSPAAVAPLISDILATSSPDVRFYGGMRFMGSCPEASPWSAFDGARFIIPAVEICRRDDRWELACNLQANGHPPSTAAALSILEGISRGRPAAPASTTPGVVGRNDTPGEAGWDRCVRKALAAFDNGHLEKVVLAREAAFEFSAPLDPASLLLHLSSVTAESFRFLFEFTPSATFLGASPERLYRRETTRLWSEALAGTRPRGQTPQADEALAAELLCSDKDIREHEFVKDEILRSLRPLCTEIASEPAPGIMRLSSGQHLLTRIEGTLLPGGSDEALLQSLHPTPAVGGTPTAPALDAIRRWEDFDRGWYAGPVGWIGATSAEFAVAIRSALAAGPFLRVYSGAGVVKGSLPAAEWVEIESKIADFLAIMMRK